MKLTEQTMIDYKIALNDLPTYIFAPINRNGRSILRILSYPTSMDVLCEPEWTDIQSPFTKVEYKLVGRLDDDVTGEYKIQIPRFLE